MLSIGPDTEVTLHFSLALESGEVIDTTMDQKPGTFSIGDETLPTGFEKLLFGLKSGDRRSFLVGPEQGFGQHRPENIQRFKAKKLFESVEGELSNGLAIVFQDASGQYVSGIVKDLPAGQVAPDQLINVDFNHPLAGRTLHFSVEIIDVKSVAQVVQLKAPRTPENKASS